MLTLWILLIGYLVLSAFFSGMEMAYISANKLKIELSKNTGAVSGKWLAYFNKKPSHYIGTYLIGNNIALVLFGGMLATILAPLLSKLLPTNLDWANLLIQTLIGTVIILLLGEFLPKLLFRLKADRLLHFFAIPFGIFYGVLYIPVMFINWLTKGIMKLFFNIELTDNQPIFSPIDLEYYIKDTMHIDHEDALIDAELLGKTLELRDLKIRECMVPRPEISAIDISESVEKLRETIIDSGYSKILVYKDDIDNVLGYVHHLDLHRAPNKIGSIIKPIPVVPESMLAKNLLQEFKSGRSIALVVDEYGGTAGIVTFEDLLEEIFGEIIDEHDDDDFIEQQLAVKEYLFSGRLEIDYLNETHNLTLPDGDFETLSGYIISLTQEIPEMSAVISTDKFEFTILNVSNTKVETVKLKVKEMD